MARITKTQLKLPKWMELVIVLASCAQAQAAPKWPLLGVSRATAHKASSLAQPPAGFVYQPVDPNYYKHVAEQTRERFRVNATFFHNINSTKVPTILHVTNGTFDVLPVSLKATPRAEDALDGECQFLSVFLFEIRCCSSTVVRSSAAAARQERKACL